MNQDDFLRLNRQQPFAPYRVVLTNGDAYDVRHPDMAIATRTSLHVGVPAPASTRDAAREVVMVSLIHVMKVEFLNTPATSGAEAKGDA